VENEEDGREGSFDFNVDPRDWGEGIGGVGPGHVWGGIWRERVDSYLGYFQAGTGWRVTVWGTRVLVVLLPGNGFRAFGIGTVGGGEYKKGKMSLFSGFGGKVGRWNRRYGGNEAQVSGADSFSEPASCRENRGRKVPGRKRGREPGGELVEKKNKMEGTIFLPRRGYLGSKLNWREIRTKKMGSAKFQSLGESVQLSKSQGTHGTKKILLLDFTGTAPEGEKENLQS